MEKTNAFVPSTIGNVFNNILRKFYSVLYLLKNIRWYAIYRIDLIRYLVCRSRKFYFCNVKKKLTLWNGSRKAILTLNSGDDAIEHNLKGLHDLSGARALRIIKPLSVIETYRPLATMPQNGGTLYDLDYPCDAEVLTIGPRTEGEIYCLRAYGFKPKNIRGLDLISYSPYIDVGDMHNMEYKDNQFEIVIASCVLVYSKEPQEACKEILRVVKNGGLICIAQDTNYVAESNQAGWGGESIFKADDYLAFFGDQVKRVIYRHELPERLKYLDSDQEGACYTCALIFQVTK